MTTAIATTPYLFCPGCGVAVPVGASHACPTHSWTGTCDRCAALEAKLAGTLDECSIRGRALNDVLVRAEAAEAKLAEAERERDEAREDWAAQVSMAGTGARQYAAMHSRLAQVLDAFERRRTGFPLGYEEETAIVEAGRAALAAGG